MLEEDVADTDKQADTCATETIHILEDISAPVTSPVLPKNIMDNM